MISPIVPPYLIDFLQEKVHEGASMRQRYVQQEALLAKQVDSGDDLFHMMASATLTRGTSPPLYMYQCIFSFLSLSHSYTIPLLFLTLSIYFF